MTARRSSGLGRVFLERYDNLKARLTRRLGSADLAGDVMQDTWLRLQDTGSTASVRQSDAYLYTIAINIARDRLRAEARRLTTDEVEALIDVPDDAPDQMQIAEDRSEWRLLETIMEELAAPARHPACGPSGRHAAGGNRKAIRDFRAPGPARIVGSPGLLRGAFEPVNLVHIAPGRDVSYTRGRRCQIRA